MITFTVTLLVVATILATLEFCYIIRRKSSRYRLTYLIAIMAFLYIVTITLINY